MTQRACRGVQTPEKTRARSKGLLCEKWLANFCSAKSHAELVHSKRAVVTLVAGKGKQRRADSCEFACPFRAGVAFFASGATRKLRQRDNNQSQLALSNGFYLMRSTSIDQAFSVFAAISFCPFKGVAGGQSSLSSTYLVYLQIHLSRVLANTSISCIYNHSSHCVCTS